MKSEGKERNNEMIIIGSKIKDIRLQKDMTQKELARLSGVLQSTISTLEKGGHDAIPTKTLKKVCEALNVNYQDIISGTKELEHLPQEVRNFVVNPMNAAVITTMYYEYMLEKAKEAKNRQANESGGMTHFIQT